MIDAHEIKWKAGTCNKRRLLLAPPIFFYICVAKQNTSPHSGFLPNWQASYSACTSQNVNKIEPWSPNVASNRCTEKHHLRPSAPDKFCAYHVRILTNTYFSSQMISTRQNQSCKSSCSTSSAISLASNQTSILWFLNDYWDLRGVLNKRMIRWSETRLAHHSLANNWRANQNRVGLRLLLV